MKPKIYSMLFSDLYPLYVNKVIRKHRSPQELNELIFWLTGYHNEDLNSILNSKLTVEDFFMNMPQLNKNATDITGVICGVRIETIEDECMKRIRYLDKLVDELAKGKPIETIKRK